MFKTLPPPERRIVFQLEQSVSSRWFTKKYMDILNNSLAVLEYSLTNIKFLAEKDIHYPHVSYLPIGTSVNIPKPASASEKKFDFIFYGDNLSSPRRRKMLEALQAKFKIKVCNDVFGEEMAQLIRQARAVINIHYYENALLEMPRIQECISLGIPILSEGTADQTEYPELEGAVSFFKEGSIEDMIQAATAMLKNIDNFSNGVIKSAARSSQRFTFMFDRFLAANGVISPNKMLETPIYLEKNNHFIGLSLPETIHRRHIFIANKPENCVVFDGIRNTKGWVGCGLSYSALARYAISNGLEQLLVIEDDVLLSDDFHKKISTVRDYLSRQNTQWDIFSGLMASVHDDAQVLNVEEWEGIKFVTINRMMSAVCNIYNKRALDLLSRWDPMDLNVDKNTIDKYLEAKDNLKVVVALPFIAGHREEVKSTLWGFDNIRYTHMIMEAERRITELADEWINKQKR